MKDIKTMDGISGCRDKMMRIILLIADYKKLNWKLCDLSVCLRKTRAVLRDVLILARLLYMTKNPQMLTTNTTNSLKYSTKTINIFTMMLIKRI